MPVHKAGNYSPVCGLKTGERKSSERQQMKGNEKGEAAMDQEHFLETVSG